MFERDLRAIYAILLAFVPFPVRGHEIALKTRKNRGKIRWILDGFSEKSAAKNGFSAEKMDFPACF